MNKKVSKKIGAYLLLIVMFVSVFFQKPVVAEAVTPGSVNYNVSLKNNIRLFMHNKKNIGTEIGTEFYMTYTVKEVTGVGTQQGILGAADYMKSYPYQNNEGMMRYTVQENFLLEEGATYFIKVTIAKGGFRYNITKAKGNELTNLYLEKLTGGAQSGMSYFGLWIAQGAEGDSNTTAELTNVRYSDVNGNDLGVQVSCDCMGIVSGGSAAEKDKALDYYYEIYIDDKKQIAISNQKPSDSETIYIEYEVERAEYKLNQEGVALSNNPKASYPHGKGQLRYAAYNEPTESIEMLKPGAEYLVVLQRMEDKYEVSVQRILDGEVVNFIFQRSYKSYKPEFQYASLWFSNELNSEDLSSFKLTKFKIYDAKKNDLGIQCNREAVIIRRGALDNYADCEATYYCKENGNSLALYSDKTFKHTKNGATEEGNYDVLNNVMTVNFGNRTETYDYYYRKITDADGNVYERLYNYRIRFVTGKGSKVETQKFSNKTGYVAEKPTDPVLEGCEFLGWYRKDGTEYQFEQLVTESVTLYAKWSGEGGIEFLAEESLSSYVLLGVSSLALAGGLVICILLIRKGVKKSGNERENERSEKEKAGKQE